MTNVEVVESLTYGLKLFAYLLGIGVLGAIGIIGSAALLLQIDGSLTHNLNSAEFLGGLVLGIFGLIVWGSGMYAVTYKLIADSVQRGVAADTSPQALSAEAESTIHKESAREQIGPSPGEQAAREFGPDSTVPSAANVPDRQAEADTDSQADASDTPETGSTEERQPPATDSIEQSPADEPSVDESAETEERTAEEIAFGTDEQGEHDAEPANETAETDEAEKPPESGSIPPYEEMDDSATAATETDELVTESGRKEGDTDENETVETGRDDTVKSNLPYKNNETSSKEPPENTVESADSSERPGDDAKSGTGGDPLYSHNSSDDDESASDEFEETSDQRGSGNVQPPDETTTKSPSEIVETGDETDTTAVPFAADNTSDIAGEDASEVVEEEASDAVEADDTERENSWDESITESNSDRGESTGEDSISQEVSGTEDDAKDSNKGERIDEGEDSDEDENSRDPLSDPF